MEKNKVVLRALEPEDVNFMLLVENNPNHWKVSETKAPFSRFLIEEYIKSSQDIYANKQVRFVIENENNDRVGFLDLFDVEFKHKRAGVGIIIMESFQNNGYAGSALEQLEEYARYIELHQLYCSIREDNKASIHLFESKGFVHCGTKKDWRLDHGDWYTELDYQKILK